MDHIAFTDESAIKLIPVTELCEVLLLNSISSPGVISLRSVMVDKSNLGIEMVRGHHIQEMTIGKFVQVLSVLVNLERHGIIYGDLKMDNLVEIDEVVKLIDFGIVNYQHHQLNLPSQTFRDRTDDFEDPGKSLVWALGVFMFRIFADRSFCSFGDYNNFVMLKDAYMGRDKQYFVHDGKDWFPLVQECMKPRKVRKNRIEDVLKFVPIPIIIRQTLTFSPFQTTETSPLKINQELESKISQFLSHHGKIVITRATRSFREFQTFSQLNTQTLAAISILLSVDIYGLKTSLVSLTCEFGLSLEDFLKDIPKFMEEIDCRLPEVLIRPL